MIYLQNFKCLRTPLSADHIVAIICRQTLHVNALLRPIFERTYNIFRMTKVVPYQSFHTCLGSPTAQSPNASCHIETFNVAFRKFDGVGTLNERSILSRHNTQPVCTPVNASDISLPTYPHDSRPAWMANPSLYDSCIRYSLSVIWRIRKILDTTIFESQRKSTSTCVKREKAGP